MIEKLPDAAVSRRRPMSQPPASPPAEGLRIPSAGLRTAANPPARRLDSGPRRLRIGVIAPPWFAVPPTGYGGIERVVAHLADGLANRGHEVTLFAPGGSRTTAHLHTTLATPQPRMIGDVATEAWHVLQATRRASEFDVIHDHSRLGFVALDGSSIPVVHTIHGAIREQEQRLYGDIGPNTRIVTISRSHRRSLTRPDRVSIIHNAVDVASQPFGDGRGEYLLFVGRLSPDKGIVDAIEIARVTGRKLVVVAKINEAEEAAYFEGVVQPLLRSVRHEYFEQPPEDVKQQCYADASALLFPIHWEEPFGLVMTEAMAAGTPVIAFNRGSVPEIIVDGKTGFIVSDVGGAVAAVDRLGEIDRVACRHHVATNFSIDLALDRHEQLYRALVPAQDG